MRRRIQRRSNGGLTDAQEGELLIGIIPGKQTVFGNDAARRAAWRKHRRRLVADAESDGRPLPRAFWEFEAPEHLRDEAEEIDLDDFERGCGLIAAFDKARSTWLADNRPVDGWFTDDERVDA